MRESNYNKTLDALFFLSVLMRYFYISNYQIFMLMLNKEKKPRGKKIAKSIIFLYLYLSTPMKYEQEKKRRRKTIKKTHAREKYNMLIRKRN